MRWFLRPLFTMSLLAALLASILSPIGSVTRIIQFFALVVGVLVVLDYFNNRRMHRRAFVPPSQVAEIERLYFRGMREMLNPTVDIRQVITDLQRIITIDPNYKNARHYLKRALLLQAEASGDLSTTNFDRDPNSAEFRRLQDLLIDPDPAVRKSVVMEFIQYGEAATDPLTALLMDEDGDVRVHAATALGWVGGKDAVQPLLVALQDNNQLVRRYASRALCWVVDESALDGLIAALHDKDSYVRRYSARALGWSQNTRAIFPLAELLRVEEAEIVREAAFTALEDLGEHDVRRDKPLVALDEE